MRAGGWLVLAVLAGAAVAVPQEVSPLGSAVAGDLETRARWGTHLQLLSSDLILHPHFLLTKNNEYSFQQLHHQSGAAAAGSVSDIYI